MSPTASLDRAGQDATSGVRPSGGASMGSGGDDRPTENISIDFGRIDDKTSGAQGQGSGGADDFVLEPGTAGAEGSSGLLDFSNIDDRGLAEAEESLAVDSASELPSGGDSATVSTFEAAYADPTGDRIEDIVTAPRPVADDFIA